MKALSAYNAVASADALREQESLVFRLSARKLREASDQTSRRKALGINHEVWSYMFRELNGSANRLPPILRKDCLTLARWSLDYSTRALLKDLSLEPLADVNDRMAEGLAFRAAPEGNVPPAPVARKPLIASA